MFIASVCIMAEHAPRDMSPEQHPGAQAGWRMRPPGTGEFLCRQLTFRIADTVQDHKDSRPSENILISSSTPEAARFLLDASLPSSASLIQRIKYADCKLSRARYTREYIRTRFELALLSGSAAKVLVVEDLDLFCPAEGSNEAVIEEFQYWLSRIKPAILLVGLQSTGAAVHELIRAHFKLSVEIPRHLEHADRLWAINAIAARSRLDGSGSEGLAASTNGLGFEDLLGLISRSCSLPASSTAGRSALDWSAIAGQEEAKSVLDEAARILWDDRLRQSYRDYKLSPVLGVLMHGPPGTGKTLLAKALAAETSAHFHAVTIPELVHAEIGRSEQALAAVFAQAVAKQPSILFIDELDAIFSQDPGQEHTTGQKLLGQLLVEFDKLAHEDTRVLVIGATNSVGTIGEALLRFGRFERLLEVKAEGGYRMAAEIIAGAMGLLDPSVVQAGLLDHREIEGVLSRSLDACRVLSGAEASQLAEEARRAAMRLREPVALAHLAHACGQFRR